MITNVIKFEAFVTVFVFKYMRIKLYCRCFKTFALDLWASRKRVCWWYLNSVAVSAFSQRLLSLHLAAKAQNVATREQKVHDYSQHIHNTWLSTNQDSQPKMNYALNTTTSCAFRGRRSVLLWLLFCVRWICFLSPPSQPCRLWWKWNPITLCVMLIIRYGAVNNQHWPFMSSTSLSRSWHHKKKKKKKPDSANWVCSLWIASMISTAFDLSCVAFEEMAPQVICPSLCIWRGWINSELKYILNWNVTRVYRSKHVNWSGCGNWKRDSQRFQPVSVPFGPFWKQHWSCSVC